MKGLYLWMLCILFLAMLLFPMLAIEAPSGHADGGSGSSAEVSENGFLVYFPDSKTTKEIPARDYLLGVLAAEMSAENHEEALKAQAVASYTFALYRQKARRAAGEPYDVVADTDDQVYITPEQAAEKWGEKTAQNTEKLQKVLSAVEGQILKYQGELILSTFHAISSGKTEAAENLWGGSYPYLVAVESVGDLLAADYLSRHRLSAEEFKKIAEGLGCTLSGEPDTWPGEPERSPSGTVLKLTLGGKTLTGAQIRTAFALRSPNFDLTYTEGAFTFTVRGYGHGAGMSQHGANYMAGQGSSYQEILSWYYPGCSIEKE